MYSSMFWNVSHVIILLNVIIKYGEKSLKINVYFE